MENSESIPVLPEDDMPQPIQKNAKLFKFILYTSKVEIKFNSLVRLLYYSSILEISLWIIGFLLFIVSPSEMYLVWLLIIHVGKGIFGIILLSSFPKTFDIMEGVAQDPNFAEDKIVDMIKKEINSSFLTQWEMNKTRFFTYVILTLCCCVIDVIIFIVQVAKWGNDEWILNQTCMLLTIVIFLLGDVVYFLWFFTLQFSLPDDIVGPIKKALFGSVKDIRNFFSLKAGQKNNQERNVEVRA